MASFHQAVIVLSRYCFYFFLAFLPVLNSAPCYSGPQDVTLYAVGDVMLGRHIAKVMSEQGADYPFGEIAPVLQSADIVFGNFEAIISSIDRPPSFPEKPYSFHASGDAAEALKKAGFHVLSLANNHAMDYGLAALSETKKLLAAKDIATFGAGAGISDARLPAIVTKKGMRFGFLGYSIAHARSVYAGKNRAGIAPVRIDDILADVQALRNQVDVLIVSLHWGIEYENVPGSRQREEAHRIIESGADIIVGHHPHVMQGVEVYKGKIIAYSLGNFIFDQKGKGTDRSFILACTFRGSTIVSAEIIPLDRFKRYFPRAATGKAKEGMLEGIKNISLPLNAKTPKLFKAGIIKVTEEAVK